MLIELEVEPPHELGDQLRHLEDGHVLADAAPGAHAELAEPLARKGEVLVWGL